MSKSIGFGNDLLKKVFHDTEYSWLPLSDYYISLHIDDPGILGNQTTNECDYGGYERISVSRNSGSWLITNNKVENNIRIVFPTCTNGTNKTTYFAIGTEKTGTGKIIYSGILNSLLNISINIQPRFSKGSIVILEK